MEHDDEYDEFDFSDDGLDALPADTLQQLEASAFRATQQEDAGNRAPESDYGIDEDGDETLGEVIDLNNVAGPAATPWAAVPQQEYIHEDYAHDEYAQAPQPPVGYTQQQAQENTYYHANNGMQYEAMDMDEPPRRSQADPNQLLQRIKKLEQEKARLAKEVQNEKSKLMLKTGETETARRRLEAATRENERRIAALQQSHNETLAKQKAELEKMRREREQAQTNTMFLEHDLAREAEKAKRMKRNVGNAVPLRPRRTETASPTTTPRRQQKTLPLRDGFDDEDMVMASPSKNRDKAKAVTPKQANKRKRQVVDQSPVPLLQLSESRSRPQEPEPALDVDKLGPALLESLRKDDRRFELFHHLVNNRSSRDNERLFEALPRYALPSQPEKKLSSRVYDELIVCGLESEVHELALKICHVFLSLWDQCLQERYYAPVYLFLDALHLILAYETCATAVALTERAIPIVLATVDLVSFPIARACMNYMHAADLYSSAQRKINSEIDVIDCLDLLHLIATSCLTSTEATTRFWQSIPIDFPLHLLRKAQPLDCIKRMLNLLSTSHLPDSIGPRVLASFGPEQQEKRETDLIDRLTKLLFDIPEPIPEPTSDKNKASSPPKQPHSQTTQHYSSKQILQLRLQILDLLTTFSVSDYGCARLAHTRYCIGRLIKFLDEQVSALYSQPLYPTRPLTISAINATMKLIYHIKTSIPNLDIKSKLSVIPGGGHKYLVALTRLAFSERLVLEEGIEKEVVDAAYSVLDAGLTPEEGEGLLRVFSSAGSV